MLQPPPPSLPGCCSAPSEPLRSFLSPPKIPRMLHFPPPETLRAPQDPPTPPHLKQSRVPASSASTRSPPRAAAPATRPPCSPRDPSANSRQCQGVPRGDPGVTRGLGGGPRGFMGVPQVPKGVMEGAQGWGITKVIGGPRGVGGDWGLPGTFLGGSGGPGGGYKYYMGCHMVLGSQRSPGACRGSRVPPGGSGGSWEGLGLPGGVGGA